MNSPQGDQGDAARRALAELLGSTEIDITGEASSRLPSGEDVRIVHGSVRGARGAPEPSAPFSALADSRPAGCADVPVCSAANSVR